MWGLKHNKKTFLIFKCINFLQTMGKSVENMQKICRKYMKKKILTKIIAVDRKQK